MAVEDNFPVSEMAKNRARRLVETNAGIEDPVERFAVLIMSGETIGVLALRHNVSIDQLAPFQAGIRFAISFLLKSGIDESQLPLDGLKDRAVEVELGMSSRMEAAAALKGQDIRAYYFEVDGGTATAGDAL